MHKLRASYTYLSLWHSGQWQKAVTAYFKLDRYISRSMADGSFYHEDWQRHINKTKTLPPVFGGFPLAAPRTEEKLVIPVYDWLDLVIVPDCVDAPIIHEFKTGVTESDEYASTRQPVVYAVGLTLLKQPVKYVDIHQYNQYSRRATYSRIVVTKKFLAEGFAWIDRVSKDMFSYFTEQNLFEKYGGQVN